MTEQEFQKSCSFVRELCSKMTAHQIAIVLGLLSHDQDEREAAAAKKDNLQDNKDGHG